jgi:hypothetical protein
VWRCACAGVRYLLLPTRSTTHHALTTAYRCGGVQLPHVVVCGARLLTLAFWWDSTHLATVEHYLSFVLTQRCVRKGTFPEDTLGQQRRSPHHTCSHRDCAHQPCPPIMLPPSYAHQPCPH